MMKSYSKIKMTQFQFVDSLTGTKRKFKHNGLKIKINCSMKLDLSMMKLL